MKTCITPTCMNAQRARKLCMKCYDKLPFNKERRSKHLASLRGTELSKKYHSTLKCRFKRGLRASKKKSLIWNISFESYIQIVVLPCHYCDRPIGQSAGYNLDRKRNDKGYTLDNVVCCCMICNRIKNKFLSYEEMIVIGKALQTFWKSNGV